MTAQATIQSQMPANDFQTLGLRDVAYIRPTAVGEGENVHIVFAIYAANGTAVGAAESRELAFAAVRQNGLEPLSVH